VEIQPAELGGLYQGAIGQQRQYQCLAGYEFSEWQPATIWPEPRATFAYLPRVPDDSKVKLRPSLGNEQWESQFCSPTGRITSDFSSVLSG
jgi:hypothetical protein